MKSVEEDLIRHLQSQQALREQEKAKSKSLSFAGKLGGAGLLLGLVWKFKVFLLVALTKLKVLLVGAKFLGIGKFLLSGGSMIASVWLYATVWGFPYALGFVLLIFVHEMGHVLALRWRHVAGTVPVFIPFVGAFVALKEMPKNAQVEAEVSLAGPLLGTVGALFCQALFWVSGNPLYLSLAYVGFFLNLFNMLPVLPLDGGRVVGAISPKLWAVGLILCAVFLFVRPNLILLILVALSLPRFFSLWKMSPGEADYYHVPARSRLILSSVYFGLAALLGVLMVESHQTLQAFLAL
ncbi:MAG: site-2 protease family protein [Armatimonadetes bacterium]|nr:site-2 protease family protein [Armatimonadota bacterium]